MEVPTVDANQDAIIRWTNDVVAEGYIRALSRGGARSRQYHHISSYKSINKRREIFSMQKCDALPPLICRLIQTISIPVPLHLHPLSLFCSIITAALTSIIAKGCCVQAICTNQLTHSVFVWHPHICVIQVLFYTNVMHRLMHSRSPEFIVKLRTHRGTQGDYIRWERMAGH